MIADIGIVFKKEFREMLLIRGSLRNAVLGTALPMIVLGFFLGNQLGPGIVKMPLSLAMWSWLPFFSVTMVVSETFAGERERHTLETLLASRLPDAAILLGKLLAATLYGVAFTGFALASGFVTIFIAHPGETPLMPFLAFVVKAVAGCFVIALFGASVGTPISLRASTVRQANQSMTLVMMSPLLLLAVHFLPESLRQMIGRLVGAIPVSLWGVVAFGAILALSLLLIGFSFHRFKRNLLILD